nr:MAG TPA: hypothetical protein [Caudoviricetes sp.]
MARFDAEMPAELLKLFDELGADTHKMLGEMTQAGAETVLANVKANVPASFRGSDIMNCLHITRVYRTPSDDGVNTKVAFYGYFTNKNDVVVPAELVCNVMEYGRSKAAVQKHPFMRKSFRKSEIEAAMQKVQDKYIPKG